MWRALHDAWWRLATTTHPRSITETLLSGVLQSSAVLYRVGVSARNQAYDTSLIRQARLPCPVISVGNLTVGGTGKTSCVELVATKLQRFGRRPAVLSRGYGSVLRRPYWLFEREGQLLVNGQPDVSRDGLADEPQLLASHLRNVPIMIGKRREQTGRQACEQFQADVIVLDDGLQYRRLHRDCEIVLIQARMPLGGWSLLPCGPMREPLSEIRRADVIIITKADQALGTSAALQERLKALNPTAIIATAIHEPVGLWDGRTGEAIALDRLEKGRVSLLSSIGDPEGFEHTIRQLGATVVSHAAYPDHHRYQPDEYREALGVASASHAEALVTTEKDFIRLRQINAVAEEASLPLWVLRIRMHLLSGEERLDDRLARVCAR